MRSNPRLIISMGIISLIIIIGWELWYQIFVHRAELAYIQARLIGYLLLMSPLILFVILVPLIKLVKRFLNKQNHNDKRL